MTTPTNLNDSMLKMNEAVQSLTASTHKWELQKAYQQGRMDADLASITSLLDSMTARLNTWTEDPTPT